MAGESPEEPARRLVSEFVLANLSCLRPVENEQAKAALPARRIDKCNAGIGIESIVIPRVLRALRMKMVDGKLLGLHPIDVMRRAIIVNLLPLSSSELAQKETPSNDEENPP